MDALAGDKWKQHMLTDDLTLQDALAWASGLDAQSIALRHRADSSFARDALAATVRREVAALQTKRRGMADSLLSLPGVRLILSADSLPGHHFNSCGYDPQNLLQIGGHVQAQMRWWRPCAGGPTTAEFNIPSISDEDAGTISAVIGAPGDVRLSSSGQPFSLEDGERRNNVPAFELTSPRASIQAAHADIVRSGNTLTVIPRR